MSLKCIGVVDNEKHDNCNYNALWIDSPLMKEVAELKAELNKAREVIEAAKWLVIHVRPPAGLQEGGRYKQLEEAITDYEDNKDGL